MSFHSILEGWPGLENKLTNLLPDGLPVAAGVTFKVSHDQQMALPGAPLVLKPLPGPR